MSKEERPRCDTSGDTKQNNFVCKNKTKRNRKNKLQNTWIQTFVAKPHCYNDNKIKTKCHKTQHLVNK